MSYTVADLSENCFEKCRSYEYSACSVPQYFADLENIEIVDKYALINDKVSKKRSINIVQVKPTYLMLPPVGQRFSFDLTKDFDPTVNWTDLPASKIDDLLEFTKIIGMNVFDNDLVTYRGVLTKIMTTPFATRESWCFGVSKFKNTIFMCPYPSPPHGDPSECNLLSYGGHRFEYFITSQKPNEMKDVPFSTVKEEYSVVFKALLRSKSNSDIKLFYAAEMDCLDSGKIDDNQKENFVEIKTTKKLLNQRMKNSFERYKLVKWWAQTYLVGIPKIVCGYKTNDHKVDSIEELMVNNIPRQCEQYWSKSLGLNFLYDFIRFIQDIVKYENDPNIVYLFSHDSGKIDSYKITSESKFRVLPHWFIDLYNE